MFNFRQFVAEKNQWSRETFGEISAAGPRGVIDHLVSELAELEAGYQSAVNTRSFLLDPVAHRDAHMLEEFCDVVLLAIDGTMRCGFSPQEFIDAIAAKQERNYQRAWKKKEGETYHSHVD